MDSFTQITSPTTGNILQIGTLMFKDCINLKNAIIKELIKIGVKIDNNFDLKKMDADDFLKYAMQIDSSKEVYDAFFKCAGQCLYNNEKIVEQIFNDEILGNASAETPGVSTYTLSDGETATAIAGSNKAIGYLGLIYAQTGNVKPIAIDGIHPGVESLRNGVYRLTRKLSLYTYGDPSPGTKRFIDFLLRA